MALGSGISASPPELRDHASAIASQAQEAQSQFTSMRTRLEPLRSQFTGQAANAFEERMAEWQSNASGLIAALEQLGSYLKNSAEIIEQTDAQLAQGLQG